MRSNNASEQTEVMYRRVLREVGLVLVAIGVVDIGFMAYCIATGRGYSSSLNVFAVIAGLFLIRGNLGATRIVTWFSAFLLAGLGSALLVAFPAMRPLDLLATEFRLDPLSSLLQWLLAAALLVVLWWVYRRLRSPAVVRAREEAGQVASAPRLAFGLGLALPAGLAILMHFTMGGDAGAKAIDLARSKAGPNYKYLVTAMSWSDSGYRATVTAWNDHEIRDVEVEWKN